MRSGVCTGSLGWIGTKTKIMKPVSLIATLATSDHRNHLCKIIIKHYIKRSFSTTIRLPYYQITDTNMKPSVGWWLKH